MTLKADESDQASGKLACPSCKETVRIPNVARPKVNPAPQAIEQLDNETGDDSEVHGEPDQFLKILYLGLVSLATIGAAGYFLYPTLSGSKEAPKSVIAANSSESTSTSSPEKKKTPRYTGTALEPISEPTSPPSEIPGPTEPEASTTTSSTTKVEKTTPPSEVPNISPRRKSSPSPAPAPRPPVRPTPVAKADPKPPPTKAQPKPGVSSPAAVKLKVALRLEEEGKKKEALKEFEELVQQYPDSYLEYNTAKNHIITLKKAMAPARPQSAPAHGGITPRG
jgi:hypothetical protein